VDMTHGWFMQGGWPAALGAFVCSPERETSVGLV
jgi:hypothetical protein